MTTWYNHYDNFVRTNQSSTKPMWVADKDDQSKPQFLDYASDCSDESLYGYDVS